MTAASSGSTGIQVADDHAIDFGTGDFTIHIVTALPDYTTGADRVLYNKRQDSSNQVTAQINNLDLMRVSAVVGGSTIFGTSSTVAPTVTDGLNYQFTWSVTRETADAAGSSAMYANGAQVGASVPIASAATTSISNTGSAFISGTNSARTASTTRAFYLYNRALSAADVQDLCNNGPAFADVGANRTTQTSGTLVLGKRYRIVTYVAGDSFTNVGAASNATGVEFVATGTTPTTWTNASTLITAGCTLQLNARDVQWNTGQMFDASGNKNHAMLPATGATLLNGVVARKREVRWTNTWSGTHELQYIGGFNQGILPSNAYIESIVGTVSGATVQDIIIGDGSDTDRYVTITTALAAGTTSFTLANRTTDGTNLKLTVDPDANATMSIAWVITYSRLE